MLYIRAEKYRALRIALTIGVGGSFAAVATTSHAEPRPALIAADEGEHLTRRWGYPLTIKVDPITTGSRQFSVGTEDIPPGNAIPPHRHSYSEEIIYVQSGTVVARVGDQSRALGPGGMAFAPANTIMGFQNVGNTTATIVWIFPEPGFEKYVRETSVPAGNDVVPMSSDEIAEIRAKYAEFIELDGGPLEQYPTEVDQGAER